jgi:predicted ester cyclase
MDAMTRQQIEALIARREKAQSDHNVPGITALYSDDVVVESPMAGGTVHGRVAVEEVNHAWIAAFPDATFTREHLVIEDDRAVWIGQVRGTDTGGFMGMAPTGKPFQLPMVVMYTVRDNAIVHEQRIYDFSGMLIQIGVLKARPI